MWSSSKLKPNTRIKGLRESSLSDFWSWAYSDILTNTTRSVFVEFFVGNALGLTDRPRIEWDAYDFDYRGSKIEVKSAAYLQSWQQKTLSRITFEITKKKSWYAATNTSSVTLIRPADIYVFCLYSETDPVKCNVLDVNAWEFYIIPTNVIEKECGNQKCLGLKRLQKLASPVKYLKINEKIDALRKEKKDKGGENAI